MRLDKLHIREFKNLRDLAVNFDESKLTTVLVGRNGAGKSNLLEALVLIFRDLDLGRPPAFDYQIDYECRGNKISVRADRELQAGSHVFTVNGRTLSAKEFGEVSEDGAKRYLPRHVFGYYSGPSGRLEEHFDLHQRRFYDDLLRGRQDSLRPLFYARLVHSQFVLLAFFSGLGDSQSGFLHDYLGIRDLDSVLFVLNEPGWAKTNRRFRDFGWFWESRGVVRDFLRRLHGEGVSLAPLQTRKERVQTTFSRSETRDHYYLYVPDAAALQRLAEDYHSQKDFFSALESTYISEMIREVRVRVKIGDGAETLTFRELSEGEQQLLMVLGLLKFTQQEESLFLLDEPDTHLNPGWSVAYLDLLRQVVGEGQQSQFIIATHDPLMIAGLKKEQVQLLERNAAGIVSVQTPDEDPRGMGVAALLTSELYGLRSQLDPKTLSDLERKRKLSVRRSSLNARERDELALLTERLGRIDLTTVSRDPLYPRFVEAMTRATPERRAPVLSREEREEQAQLALKIAGDLARQQDAAEKKKGAKE